MSFAATIRRAPLATDPDTETAVAATWADQPPEVRAVLAGAACGSPHLRHLMAQKEAWLREALSAPPASLAETLAEIPDIEDPAVLGTALRAGKRRLSLYTGLADLAGVWPLETVTGALSAFADASVAAAVRAHLRPLVARGHLPGQSLDNLESACGFVALAMGKMGAGELNYSSDIDLICLFDDGRYPGTDAGQARSSLVKMMRQVTSTLQDITAEGYVWRVDLRLRPDPSVTPIVQSMSAAERYYESLGRTWERAAHIKARPAAGDLEAGAAYLERLRPFVWRRHLDFAAVQDAHDIRLRIRDHRGLYDSDTLEGRDLKLGPGGIREIEFFTQTRQLIAGGRDPELRHRGTVPALAALAEKGWVEAETAARLTEHYRVFREIEHRVQMVDDARTHALPTSPEGMDRIARLCGEGDTSRFRDQLLARLAAVADDTDGFFEPAKPADATPVAEPDIVSRWWTYPALRSERAQASMERLKPDLLARLAQAAKPEEALMAFDAFLARLPAGVQLFALFEANPQLRALITDIAATAPGLAQYLAANARVLDAVIGGDFFAPWPDRAVLWEAAEAEVARAEDHEDKLNAIRRWQAEAHFRIGVHLLRGLVDTDEAGRHYAALAEACVRALYPVAVDYVARRHGPPPGRGAAVLAMGSLGAGWLHARSDLDLILIYDAPPDALSDGKRPLDPRGYYAKLTQALVTAVSAATAQGRLYEVDMRLRPSGRSGPVATSLSAFARYQRDEAWTWELMALTRARSVAGHGEVGAEVEAVRREVLTRTHDPAKVLADVGEMRARLQAAKPHRGPFDVKPGPGGLQDLELMGQAAALVAGQGSRETPSQLTAAEVLGVSASDTILLVEAAERLRRVLGAARLVDAGPAAIAADFAVGAQTVLCREAKSPGIAELEAALIADRHSVNRIVSDRAPAPS